MILTTDWWQLRRRNSPGHHLQRSFLPCNITPRSPSDASRCWAKQLARSFHDAWLLFPGYLSVLGTHLPAVGFLVPTSSQNASVLPKPCSPHSITPRQKISLLLSHSILTTTPAAGKSASRALPPAPSSSSIHSFRNNLAAASPTRREAFRTSSRVCHPARLGCQNQ